MSKERELLNNISFNFRPKEILKPSEFCEKYIVLDGPAEVMQGPINLSITPWVKYILDRGIDPKFRDISLQFSTQTAKTLTLRLMAAFIIANYGGSMMFAFPNEKLAKSFSEKRWLPLINHCEPLYRLKTESKHDFNKLNQNLINAVIKFVGSHSPANLSSESARWLIVDEINKLAESSENSKEADAVSLIKERTKAFSNIGFKRLFASTPTDFEGVITEHIEDGTNTIMLVRSPFAPDREAFELVTKGLRCAPECKQPDGSYNWDMVLSTAHYVCPHTGNKIQEHHKPGMLSQAEYKDTNPNPNPFHFSFRLSALYSPFVKWGEVLVEFLKSRGSVEKMRNYTNNYEGLPFNPFSYSDFSKSLRENKVCGEYQRGAEDVGTVPLMLIDVQQSTFKWIIQKYTGKKAYLIEWGECSSFEELDVVHHKWNPYRTGIDSGQGQRKAEIYKAVDARRHLGWVALKGVEKMEKAGILHHAQKVNPHDGTVKQGLGKRITLLTINRSATNVEINFQRNGGSQDWRVPHDVTESFETEVFNEIPKKSADKFGRVTTNWHKLGTQDYWDCLNYAYALADWSGVTELREYTPRLQTEQFIDEMEDVIEEVKVISATEKKERPRYIPISQRRVLGGDAL